MIIEIRGTGTHNKGAELMLQAVLQELGGGSPDLIFAVNRMFGPYRDRAKYGLRTLLPASGIRSLLISSLAANSFLNAYGLVKESQVNAVIDASGFAFGDQWGLKNLKSLCHKSRMWKKRGVRTIFLPQAWGPFSTEDHKRYASEAISNIDLVFAREEASYQHIRSLGISLSNVRKSHDFTNLIEAKMPEDLTLPETYACIVPNVRMLDRTNPTVQQSYLGFLCNVIQRLKERNLTPIFLLHDPLTDAKLAEAVKRNVGCEISQVSLGCPRELKGVIGRARLLIGSRFHAIVGALSQGVPVIATSWSHKYEELLSEYGVDELLIDLQGEDKFDSILDKVLTNPHRSELIHIIRERSEKFRHESIETFKLTRQILGLR